MRSLVAGLLMLSVLMFQNCAPKQFSDSGEGSATFSSLGQENTSSANGGGNLPATGSTPVTSSSGASSGSSSSSSSGSSTGSSASSGTTSTVTPVYPTIQMRIPRCSENQTCAVRVLLSRVDSSSVGFQWRTFDERAQQDPRVYGQPNVHYVPTQGTVTIQPGQTQGQMPIRFLSGFVTIKVPFQWWDCRYNGSPISCDVFNFSLIQE